MALQNGSYVRFLKLTDLFDDVSVLSTRQVQKLLFGEGSLSSWNAVSCRTWLKKLVDGGMVKRCYHGRTYCYWMNEKPDQLAHRLAVTDAYVTLMLAGRLQKFKREAEVGQFRPDAFFTFDGKPFYLEVHLKKYFSKVKQYADWWKSEKWNTDGWPLPGKFARILVITPWKAQIQRKIERENKDGLVFLVATMDEFKANPLEVMGLAQANNERISTASQ